MGGKSSAEYHRNYRARHRQRIRRYMRAYYVANQARLKARSKANYHRPRTEAELAERRRRACIRSAKYLRTPKGRANSKRCVARFSASPKGIACAYRARFSPKGLMRAYRRRFDPKRIAWQYRYNHRRVAQMEALCDVS